MKLTQSFNEEHFYKGVVDFTVREKPVSSQNKNQAKVNFKNRIRKITSTSEFIITNTCWVHIDYYCSNFHRLKNPGVYDMDNIIKPIIDGLTGAKGIIIDDVLFDRVSVNWIDTGLNDHFEINIEYPNLLYVKKEDLIFVKSENGWCFPTTIQEIKDRTESIKLYFDYWEKVQCEDDYYNVIKSLPIQNFVYFSKVKDKEFNFIDLSAL